MKKASNQSPARKKDFTLLKFRTKYPQPFDTRFAFRLSYFLPNRKPVENRPTAHALKIQRQRLAALNRMNRLVQGGSTKSAAAKAARMSLTTAWRLRRAFTVGGAPALLPKVITGRPGKIHPKVSELSRSKAEGLALLQRSAKAGWIAFAKTRDCPPALAKYIQTNQASLPAAMLRAVRVRRVSVRLVLGPTLIALWARRGDLEGRAVAQDRATGRGAATGRRGGYKASARGKRRAAPFKRAGAGLAKKVKGVKAGFKSRRLPV
jgi:hypothetical protein